MIDITLAKLKYRNPNRKSFMQAIGKSGDTIRTFVYLAGSYKSPASNSGKAQKAKQGMGPRRRHGLGAVGQ